MSGSGRRRARQLVAVALSTALATSCASTRPAGDARASESNRPVRVDVAGTTLTETSSVDGRVLLARYTELVRAGRTNGARRALLRRPEAAVEAFTALPPSAELRELAVEYERALGTVGTGWDRWVDLRAASAPECAWFDRARTALFRGERASDDHIASELTTAVAAIEWERLAGAARLDGAPDAAHDRFARGAELARGRAYERAELAVLASASNRSADGAETWSAALEAVLTLVERGAAAPSVLERAASALPATLAEERASGFLPRATRLAIRALDAPPAAADGAGDLAWSLWSLAGSARLERGEARAAVLAFSRAVAAARTPRAAGLARAARGAALARAQEGAAARTALTAESVAEDSFVASAALAGLGALELADGRAGIARALLERADTLAGPREADGLTANLAIARLASGETERGLALLRAAQDDYERRGLVELLELALENELEHLRAAPAPERERAVTARLAGIR